MINTIAVSAQLGDQPDRRTPQQDDPQAAKAKAAPPQEQEHDVRLVIEPDAGGEALFYKLIDRTTGEVVSTVSRDDLIKMGADPTYTAGAAISTKA
jgi:hypothetical protein